MAQVLSVRNFACIEEAEFRLAPLTVLIGPQASGKSILAKLSYMFQDFIRNAPWEMFRGAQESGLDQRVLGTFSSWFPKKTWGEADFEITYRDGGLAVKITRDFRNDTITSEVDGYAEGVYEGLRSEYAAALSQMAEEGSGSDLLLKTQSPLVERFYNALRQRDARIPMALFIPSGRSIFTSLAHTGVATFTESKTLDPVTRNYGSLVTSLREIFTSVLEDRMPEEAWSLLGGRIVREGSEDVLLTPDSRIVPLYLMSSGQQELYPLLIALAYSKLLHANYSQSIYIEEPEAHLFPDAQSALIEMIVRMAAPSTNINTWMFTTHSPYCLSKINNLLQAGRIAHRSENDAQRVRSAVNEDLWIRPEDAAIYAIKDKCLINLVDDEGQIDSDYLDGISSEISREFGRLLEIEFGG